MQKLLSVTFALLSSLMLLSNEASARGGGGRHPQSYGTWFSETIKIPGNPELEVTFSKASKPCYLCSLDAKIMRLINCSFLLK